MIKTFVTLACCALVAPLAFGQTRSHHKGTTNTTVEQTVTVTGTIITASEDGAAANYQPANITFDLLPALDEPTRLRLRRDKRARHAEVCRRSIESMDRFLEAEALHV